MHHAHVRRTCLIPLVLALLGGSCKTYDFHRDVHNADGTITRYYYDYVDVEDTEEYPACSGMLDDLRVLVEQGSAEALDLITEIRRSCSRIVEDEYLTAVEIDTAARHGQHERVIKTMTRYWNIHWSYPDRWRVPLAKAYLARASTLPPEEAIAGFQRTVDQTESFLAQDPGDARLHVLHAAALEGLGRWEDALVAYAEAEVHAEDDAKLRALARDGQARLEVLCNMVQAETQIAEGEFRAGLDSIEAVPAQEPDHPRALGIRAYARWCLLEEESSDEEMEAILADCRAAAAGGDGRPRLVFLEGYMLDRLGRSLEALPAYRRYLLGDLDLEPSQILVFASERRAILAALETGMTELACATSASQLRPLRERAAAGDVEALKDLGEVVMVGGPGLVPDVELAMMWWTRAAEDPDSPSADAAWLLFRADASLEQLDAWSALVAEDPDATAAAREAERERAEAWLERAAELGSPDAGYELALRAEFEDPVESLAWALVVVRDAEGALLERANSLVARHEEALGPGECAEARQRASQR